MKNEEMQLKPNGKAELLECSEPRGIRKRLEKYYYYNTLTRSTMDACRYHGYSGEDSMTVLAFNALVRLERVEQMLLDSERLNITPAHGRRFDRLAEGQ